MCGSAGRFADGGDAAVAEPAMLAVGAGAVEHDVGLLDALAALVVAQQQAERLLPPRGVAGSSSLRRPRRPMCSTLRLGLQAVVQRRRLGQRLEVGGEVFAAGDAVVVGGEVVLRLLGRGWRPGPAA